MLRLWFGRAATPPPRFHPRHGTPQRSWGLPALRGCSLTCARSSRRARTRQASPRRLIHSRLRAVLSAARFSALAEIKASGPSQLKLAPRSRLLSRATPLLPQRRCERCLMLAALRPSPPVPTRRMPGRLPTRRAPRRDLYFTPRCRCQRIRHRDRCQIPPQRPFRLRRTLCPPLHRSSHRPMRGAALRTSRAKQSRRARSRDAKGVAPGLALRRTL